jgi:hypothetical protein
VPKIVFFNCSGCTSVHFSARSKPLINNSKHAQLSFSVVVSRMVRFPSIPPVSYKPDSGTRTRAHAPLSRVQGQAASRLSRFPSIPPVFFQARIRDSNPRPRSAVAGVKPGRFAA